MILHLYNLVIFVKTTLPKEYRQKCLSPLGVQDSKMTKLDRCSKRVVHLVEVYA